ncbi:MAG TPA: hypothetical protein VGR57_03130 [Ktedonobacterales bacterium]|nr:hypothetical protein [Ktedonobacterales bacterium]
MDPYFGISGCGPLPARQVDMPESERERAALRVALDAAARALAEDADQAALLLDGVAARCAACWYARHDVLAPDAAEQLADLARRDAPFARRLWLALRAPDPAARLEHAHQLLRALDATDATDAAGAQCPDDDPNGNPNGNPNDVSATRAARLARAAG